MTPHTLRCAAVDYELPGSGGAPRAVLRGLEVELRSETISIIGGPTGAGKSTLLHLLAGLMRPTAGAVYADGEPVSRWTAGHRDRWRRTVGLAFQWFRGIPELPVLDNAVAPLVPRAKSWPELSAAGRTLLARCGLEQRAELPAGALSGGERQRLELARALAMEPTYLLLDEPTASQDDDGCALVARLIGEEHARGALVVVASHDPRLADQLEQAERYDLVDGALERRQ